MFLACWTPQRHKISNSYKCIQDTFTIDWRRVGQTLSGSGVRPDPTTRCEHGRVESHQSWAPPPALRHVLMLRGHPEAEGSFSLTRWTSCVHHTAAGLWGNNRSSGTSIVTVGNPNWPRPAAEEEPRGGGGGLQTGLSHDLDTFPHVHSVSSSFELRRGRDTPAPGDSWPKLGGFGCQVKLRNDPLIVCLWRGHSDEQKQGIKRESGERS